MTKSVDFGAFGIAAALLGAAAGEPVVVIASTCNRGMAIIAKKDAGIAAIKDLKGKRVAVFPGTTQEVFFLERLRMEGMTIKDVEPVRVSFSEMHIALARGDIDAYVGAEPGPGVSLVQRRRHARRISVLDRDGRPEHGVRHPSRHDRREARPRPRDAGHPQQGDGVRVEATRTRWSRWRPASSGRRRRRSRPPCPNVELTWRLDAKQIGQAKIYADHMLALKQIKRLPDFATFIDTRFVDAMKPT